LYIVEKSLKGRIFPNSHVSSTFSAISSPRNFKIYNRDLAGIKKPNVPRETRPITYFFQEAPLCMHADAYHLHREKNYDRNRMFETLWVCVLVAHAIPEIKETIRMFEYTIRVVVIKFFRNKSHKIHKLSKTFKVTCN